MDYVGINLWANTAWNTFEQSLGTWYLDACVYRAHCSSTITVPLSQRVAIERGKTWLSAKIDPFDRHAETTEDEGDNRRVRYMDDFFAEGVPSIMRGHAASWRLASDLLDRWFDRGQRQKANISGIDWNLGVNIPVGTDWFLQTQNASNGRIRQKYNTLISPSYFNTPATRRILRGRIIAKFSQHPGASTVSLAQVWRNGDMVKSYHDQHFTHIEGQAAYSSLDAVTAAFGSFSFYLVPLGNAVKIGRSYYHVTINRVAVHVMDSFDFNGTQDLGCWGQPNRVVLSYLPGLQCLSNSSFRYYRNMKARGFDHNVFTTPIVYTLPTPVVYDLTQP